MWNSCILVAALALLCTTAAMEVGYDANAMIINGERKLIISGAIHYPRSTPEMWPDLINKSKEGGLNTIESYIFWNAHEPRRGEYNFEGNLDFIKFYKLIQEAGLYAILRIGPYVCAEWNYGGFPAWLHNIEGIELRTDNEIYKNEMKIFTTKIVKMCKEANLFAPQGGPIILAQIENEFGNFNKEYGDRGKAYIKWCAEMAVAQNIGVPWIMCKQDNAPEIVINTENGFYADTFKPINPKNPKMFTENWTGWFKLWGQKNPHRTAEDLAFSVARFFQFGGVLINYYMYHGGTNFGRTAGGPYMTTSYDYDAPLDEYGNLNQPKWGHLKQFHEAIKMGEKILTGGSATTKDLENGVQLTTYTNDTTGDTFCFLSNIDHNKDVNIELPGAGKFFVPAWSVSILGQCKREIYNTAKVNTHATIMEMKQISDEEKPTQLSWMWTLEAMNDTLQGKGKFTSTNLLEQKRAAVDASDYLWYMTSVKINDTSSNKMMTLYANSSGQVLHAYVNGMRIGTQSGDAFRLSGQVSLKPGKNIISLLSATVGLKHYGAFYDMVPAGVTGPVVLTDNDKFTLDLSNYTWNYKVGLNGEAAKHLYNSNSTGWTTSEEVPTSRPMIWYKTTFKAPAGTDPVALDLQGMGKGHAWINGKSIGRFWPSRIADSKGCNAECNYRGPYKEEKCAWNCGKPTQRWYHVPRSFLYPDGNTLVLFEEMGGDPSQVSFQTVSVGTVCANAEQGKKLELSCHGGGKLQTISGIKFASFGNAKGSCGSFKQESCHASQSQSVVEQACVGKESCSIDASDSTFGTTNCGDGITKKLVVQATCEKESSYLKKLKRKSA